MATKNQTLSVMLDGSGNVKTAHNPSMGLSNLSDVDTTGIANDKTLKYNSGTSKWEIADLAVDTSSLISIASVDSAFTTLVGTAPAELDTLSEIATRLADDPTFGTGWTAYQNRQRTKTWTGMTGKGPTGASLPLGPSGTVQLTNGVNTNGDTVGIPVDADLRYANIEVFLNGVLMKNIYRSASDGTTQWASGAFDYHPHDGTVSAGSTFTSLTHSSNFNPDTSGDTFTLYFDLDISAGQTTFGSSSGQDIYTSNSAEYGTVYFKTGSSIGDPAEGGAGDQDGTYAYRYARAGIEDPQTTFLKFEAQENDWGNTGMDWWFGNYNYGHYNTNLQIMWLATGNSPSTGGATIWDGNGTQPTLNYIIFPTIDFVADDVLTIRTF